MALIEQSTLIHAPIDAVYAASQDYAVRYDWDPFPDQLRVVKGSADDLAVGTQVLVRSKLGMEMLVEFVQVAPPQRAAIKMVQGPWFIARFAGSWIFEAQGPTSTKARFRYALSTRPAAVSWALDRIAASYFNATAAKRLAGLKRYCESTAATPPSA